MTHSSLTAGAAAAPGAQSASRALGARLFRHLGLLAVMVAVLAVSLAGCSGTSPAPTTAPTAAAQPTKGVSTEAPTAAQPTKAAAAPTQAPTATSAAATKVAPTATGAPASQPTAAAKTASFAKEVLPIFQQNCVQCHGGQSTKAGLVLKTYADVMKGSQNGAVIKPGDSKNSFLVQQIVNGKMPQRAPKLSQALIDTIAAWVDAGAPNN